MNQELKIHRNVIKLESKHLNLCLELDKVALDQLWTRNQWIHVLSSPEHMKLGIKRGEKMIALACASKICDELHIIALAVHPVHRRNGLGNEILTTLLNNGKSYGMQSATLEVKSSNGPANAIYRKLGFNVKGCRKQYFKDGSDALILWLYFNDQKSRPKDNIGTDFRSHKKQSQSLEQQ